MVEGEGFEPSKAEPADLQSAPFDRSGTQPNIFLWCRLSESNQSPTDYKSVALPDELKRHKMAGATRIELATSCVTGRRSNQTELRPHFMVVPTGLEPVTPCL